MPYIDTHTHIYLPEYADDRDAVVARAVESGCVGMLLPNVDEGSVEAMLAACRRYPEVCRPMIGLHPTELPADVPAALQAQKALLEALLRDENPALRPVAVGEVGLDYYWDASRKEEQRAAFEEEIAWAAAYDLPLVVHARNAHADLINTLLPHRESLQRGGIFHCFGGTIEEASTLLEAFPHFCLGIGGILTFKKSTLPEVLRTCVPLERIVVETDAPWLAPTPHRGTRNEPSYIPYVLRALAEIYNLPQPQIEAALLENTRRLFSI